MDIEYIKERIIDGNIAPAECENIQNYLRSYICQESSINIDNIKYVAGVDIAYWNEKDQENAVCCIVIVDFKNGNVVERVYAEGITVFPYIAGFLSFRELPIVFKAIDKITVFPDIYMFDGNGLLHPRKMGIATMASIFLKKPALGVAKSYYKIKDCCFEMPDTKAGSFTYISVENDVIGVALRTHCNVKPVFVSVGNLMTLNNAISITKKMINNKSHIPIPIREADLYTHEMRNILQNKL